MSKRYLVLAEAHGIQNYVFGSNRLAENIGASYLVGKWSNEELRSHLKGILQSKDQELVKDIYAGGGNTMFEVETDSAEVVIHKLTREILVKCPGLLFTIVYEEMKPAEQFRELYIFLREKLVAVKHNRKNTAPQLSFAVTRRCESTGLPAHGMTKGYGGETEPDRPANMAILQKYGANYDARKHLEHLCHEQLKRESRQTFTFPYQLDDLGRSASEHSYIAVVHIDGDSMGEHLEREVRRRSDDDARTFLDEFSNRLKEVGTETLRSVVEQLQSSVKIQEDRASIHHTDSKFMPPIELKQHDNGQWFLPFRPIIYGGDDMTFVCDGRLAISLAIAFMKEFQWRAKNLPGGAITASAGIAIVKTHYPFARAYDLAEQLCSNAKKYKRHNEITDAPCFDWHFALSGLSGDLDEIREKEYEARTGRLYSRPYILGDLTKYKEQSWKHLSMLLKGFQAPEKGWLEQRNKMEKLKRALRDGPDQVTWFRQKFLGTQELPSFKNITSDWLATGWAKGDAEQEEGKLKCLHFDALEIADWYMPLDAHEEGGSLS